MLRSKGTFVSGCADREWLDFKAFGCWWLIIALSQEAKFRAGSDPRQKRWLMSVWPKTLAWGGQSLFGRDDGNRGCLRHWVMVFAHLENYPNQIQDNAIITYASDGLWFVAIFRINSLRLYWTPSHLVDRPPCFDRSEHLECPPKATPRNAKRWPSIAKHRVLQMT